MSLLQQKSFHTSHIWVQIDVFQLAFSFKEKSHLVQFKLDGEWFFFNT